MMKLSCPSSENHKRFHVSALVAEDWEVDDYGVFDRVLGISEVVERPDYEVATCAVCGADAIIKNI